MKVTRIFSFFTFSICNMFAVISGHICRYFATFSRLSRDMFVVISGYVRSYFATSEGYFTCSRLYRGYFVSVPLITIAQDACFVNVK